MGECAWSPVPWFVHGIDGQAYDVREKCRTAVGVPALESSPQIRGLLRERIRPVLVPNADRLGRRAVIQSRRLRAETDALQIELETAVRAVVIEDLERQGVERCDKRYLRLLTERLA